MAISEHHALEPGSVLGDYVIESVLGQGGFGITYRAANPTLHQRVAIKEFLPTSFAYRDATRTVRIQSDDYDELFRWGLERFLEEARILANMRHPNIVRVLNYMKANGTGYMIMDYVEGQTLGDWADAWRGRVPQSALLGLCRPLLDALAAVHEKGITHRDIKPDNVLMTHEGAPVLIDFGAARNTVGGRSQTVAAIVSPGYSPNEQYSTVAKQGAYTDIYAAAAVLYSLILGEAPPEAPLRVERAMANEHDPCVELTAAGLAEYDHEFLSAIDWALNIRPLDRPQSVAEWRRRLEASLEAPTGPVEAVLPERATTGFAEQEAERPRESRSRMAPLAPVDVAPVAPGGRGFAIPLAIAGGVAAIGAVAVAVWLMSGSGGDQAGATLDSAYDLGTIGVSTVSVAEDVGGADEVDMYRFRLDGPADLTVTIDPATALSLQNAAGEALRLNEAGNALVAELDAGTYTLAATGGAVSAPYRLAVSARAFEGGVRPGRNFASAGDLGTLGPVDMSRLDHAGKLEAGRDDQYFAFTLDADASVSLELQRREGRGELVLYDEGRRLIRRLDSRDDVAATAREPLPAGRYFLRLQRQGDAAYQYDLAVLAAPLAGDAAAVIGHRYGAREAISFDTARALPPLSEHAVRPELELPAEAASRFFAFDLAGRALVTLEASEPRLTAVAAYDKATTDRIAATSVTAGTVDQTLDLPAGTYVVMFEAGAGEPVTATVSIAAFPAGDDRPVPGTSNDAALDFGRLDDRFTRLPVRAAGPAHIAFSTDTLADVTLEVRTAVAADNSATDGMVELGLAAGGPRRQVQLAGGRAGVLLAPGSYRAVLAPSAGAQALSIGLSGLAVAAGEADAGAPVSLTETATVVEERRFVAAGKNAVRRIELAEGLDFTARLAGLDANVDLVVADTDGHTIAASRQAGLMSEELFLAAGDAPRTFDLVIKADADWPSRYDLAIAAAAATGEASGDRAARLYGSLVAGDTRLSALGAAGLGGDIADGETRGFAARAQARAALLDAAAGREPDDTPVSGFRQWAAAIAALEAGLPLAEKWGTPKLSGETETVGLEANIRVLASGLVTAELSAEDYVVGDHIRFTATGGETPVALGVFALFENESVVRLYPDGNAPALSLEPGVTIGFPRGGEPPIMSAPSPGRTANIEAVLVVACAGPVDFGKVAPRAGETGGTSLVRAVSTPSFVQGLNDACPNDLALVAMPYVIRER